MSIVIKVVKENLLDRGFMIKTDSTWMSYFVILSMQIVDTNPFEEENHGKTLHDCKMY